MRALGYLALLLCLTLCLGTYAYAGVYHNDEHLVCYDCHSIHYSQQHEYDGTPGQGKPPLAFGPHAYLLRQPANQLCLSCHDGQTFAPDVLAANTNAASYVNGRQAGGLNEVGVTEGEGYESWMGHTLNSTDTPPGGTWSGNASAGLMCVHCHHQHGYAAGADSYRNMSYNPGGAAFPGYQVTYTIDTAEDNTVDVRIDMASYTAGTGNAATFGPFYSFDNILFNEPDSTASEYAAWCSDCHTDFHGTANTGPGPDHFIRHPNAGVDVGAVGGGHSNLARYQNATTKVQTLTDDHTSYASVTPSCMSCHKAHGNMNPFGLFFLNTDATSITEEGGYGTGQTLDTETGLRNLCGQCHVQGN